MKHFMPSKILPPLGIGRVEHATLGSRPGIRFRQKRLFNQHDSVRPKFPLDHGHQNRAAIIKFYRQFSLFFVAIFSVHRHRRRLTTDESNGSNQKITLVNNSTNDR